MNSSKVKTRGLQHFHPITLLVYYIVFNGLKIYIKKTTMLIEKTQKKLSYLSAPRERQVDQGGNDTPPLGQYILCRSPGGHTFAPWQR